MKILRNYLCSCCNDDYKNKFIFKEIPPIVVPIEYGKDVSAVSVDSSKEKIKGLIAQLNPHIKTLQNIIIKAESSDLKLMNKALFDKASKLEQRSVEISRETNAVLQSQANSNAVALKRISETLLMGINSDIGDFLEKEGNAYLNKAKVYENLNNLLNLQLFGFKIESFEVDEQAVGHKAGIIIKNKDERYKVEFDYDHPDQLFFCRINGKGIFQRESDTKINFDSLQSDVKTAILSKRNGRDEIILASKGKEIAEKVKEKISKELVNFFNSFVENPRNPDLSILKALVENKANNLSGDNSGKDVELNLVDNQKNSLPLIIVRQGDLITLKGEAVKQILNSIKNRSISEYSDPAEKEALKGIKTEFFNNQLVYKISGEPNEAEKLAGITQSLNAKEEWELPHEIEGTAIAGVQEGSGEPKKNQVDKKPIDTANTAGVLGILKNGADEQDRKSGTGFKNSDDVFAKMLVLGGVQIDPMETRHELDKKGDRVAANGRTGQLSEVDINGSIDKRIDFTNTFVAEDARVTEIKQRGESSTETESGQVEKVDAREDREEVQDKPEETSSGIQEVESFDELSDMMKKGVVLVAIYPQKAASKEAAPKWDHTINTQFQELKQKLKGNLTLVKVVDDKSDKSQKLINGLKSLGMDENEVFLSPQSKALMPFLTFQTTYKSMKTLNIVEARADNLAPILAANTSLELNRGEQLNSQPTSQEVDLVLKEKKQKLIEGIAKSALENKEFVSSMSNLMLQNVEFRSKVCTLLETNPTLQLQIVNIVSGDDEYDKLEIGDKWKIWKELDHGDRFKTLFASREESIKTVLGNALTVPDLMKKLMVIGSKNGLTNKIITQMNPDQLKPFVDLMTKDPELIKSVMPQIVEVIKNKPDLAKQIISLIPQDKQMKYAEQIVKTNPEFINVLLDNASLTNKLLKNSEFVKKMIQVVEKNASLQLRIAQNVPLDQALVLVSEKSGGLQDILNNVFSGQAPRVVELFKNLIHDPDVQSLALNTVKNNPGLQMDIFQSLEPKDRNEIIDIALKDKTILDTAMVSILNNSESLKMIIENLPPQAMTEVMNFLVSSKFKF